MQLESLIAIFIEVIIRIIIIFLSLKRLDFNIYMQYIYDFKIMYIKNYSIIRDEEVFKDFIYINLMSFHFK